MVHIIPESGFANTYLIEEDAGLIAVDVGSIGAAQEVATYCTGATAPGPTTSRRTPLSIAAPANP
jgi:hypothetical protein